MSEVNDNNLGASCTLMANISPLGPGIEWLRRIVGGSVAGQYDFDKLVG